MTPDAINPNSVIVGIALLIIIWQTKEVLGSLKRLEMRLLRVEFKIGLAPEGIEGGQAEK